jgi:hypothetical protein
MGVDPVKLIPVADTIDEAWLNTLEQVRAEPGGRAVNVVTTVARPVDADLAGLSISPHFRAALESTLIARHPSWNTVESVADTIFPSSLYRWHRSSWSPDLEEAERLEIEARATAFFDQYVGMHPLIKKAPANRWGDTYFGRLVNWDGNNQLDYWISALRGRRGKDKKTFGEANLAVAGEGEIALGGQLRASTDHHHMGGPCLVHINLSVVDSHLHLLANYRHWYLQERAYGNLVGLASLLRFISQQTGYQPGELMVVSGIAKAQTDTRGGGAAIDSLTKELRTLVGPK